MSRGVSLNMGGTLIRYHVCHLQCSPQEVTAVSMTGMSTSHPPVWTNAVLTRVHSPSDDLEGVVAGDTWQHVADVVGGEVQGGVEVPVREIIGHRAQNGACVGGALTKRGCFYSTYNGAVRCTRILTSACVSLRLPCSASDGSLTSVTYQNGF